MNILLIATAFNGLSQRVWAELRRTGHRVETRVLPEENDAQVRAWVEELAPQAIIAPFLKTRIPTDLSVPTIIIHPGIPGDAGPASIDWAILNNETTWGAEAILASEVMDGGDLYAHAEFPMRRATKSNLYSDEITEAAVSSALKAIASIEVGHLPTPQTQLELRGQTRRALKNADRDVDFKRMDAEQLVRIIRASDSQPGARAVIGGQMYRLYDAHVEDAIGAQPGEIKATRHGAVLIGTTTRPVWVGVAKKEGAGQVKRPAAHVLPLEGAIERDFEPWRLMDGQTFQDLKLTHHANVTVIEMLFYNGAFSTERSRRVLAALEYAERDDRTKLIVLTGSSNFFCNGIDLNTIHSSPNPALEAWRSINAINDIALKITTCKKAIITAFSGNAGAGGVMVGLGADRVVSRSGAMLNPHYKGIGLFGSELWTYNLPRRVGPIVAEGLTEGLLPLGIDEALELGLVDAILPRPYQAFQTALLEYAQSHVARAEELVKQRLARITSSATPLAAHLAVELSEMSRNMFGDSLGFAAKCAAFVTKIPQCATPRALHNAPLHGASQHGASQQPASAINHLINGSSANREVIHDSRTVSNAA